MSDNFKTILVTDCGSTTTKALLFQKTSQGWRQTWRGEAPTTVEAPVADVTVGALNAFNEIEEISGRRIIDENNISQGQPPFISNNSTDSAGIDLYLSTSSAGGGLQMLVSGLVSDFSAQAAARAALGAGAIVLETFSADDGLEDYQRIEKIRQLKPDIFLLSGGTENGAYALVEEFAEILSAAAPRPRFGKTLKLPVIYAGNSAIRESIKKILAKTADVIAVENLFPEIGQENLKSAREAVHELFLSHVMSHSPGYDKLLAWASRAIIPTPSAVGIMIEGYARKNKINVLCADIGGATTDVFSVIRKDQEFVFNRTVSANLGMSYSVANVLLETGAANIARWLPYQISDEELRDRLRNKMIRPTSIPQTMEDLYLEQAVCREALRLSLKHHASLATGLSGVKKQKDISQIFSQKSSRNEFNVGAVDLVIGSGGVLSHAPQRMQAALMMIDGFNLQGLTEIAVDSIFMLPHLGVLSTVNPAAAEEIFVNDCLIKVAHSLVPAFNPNRHKAKEIAAIYINGTLKTTITKDNLEVLPLQEGQEYEIRVLPHSSDIDVGAGFGQELTKIIIAGQFGLILDGRNVIKNLPADQNQRALYHQNTFKQAGI